MKGWKMIKQFATNFVKSSFCTDRELQIAIIIAALIITFIIELIPSIKDSAIAIIVGIIIVGGPVTLLAIYDGIIKDD